MKICAVIPALNQASRIAEVVTHVKKKVSPVVVIDDGSSDNTAERAAESGALVLINKTNQGKGAALKRGFSYAVAENYDAVITLDADGQHDPAEIDQFFPKASHADIVLGCRMHNVRSMPRSILYTNKALSLIVSLLTQQTIADSQSGFRLIKSSVLKSVHLVTNHYEVETELLIKAYRAGFTIVEVPIKTIYHRVRPRPSAMLDALYFIRLFLSPHLYLR